jgi:hypothetical protein
MEMDTRWYAYILIWNYALKITDFERKSDHG